MPHTHYTSMKLHGAELAAQDTDEPLESHVMCLTHHIAYALTTAIWIIACNMFPCSLRVIGNATKFSLQSRTSTALKLRGYTRNCRSLCEELRVNISAIYSSKACYFSTVRNSAVKMASINCDLLFLLTPTPWPLALSFRAGSLHLVSSIFRCPRSPSVVACDLVIRRSSTGV